MIDQELPTPQKEEIEAEMTGQTQTKEDLSGTTNDVNWNRRDPRFENSLARQTLLEIVNAAVDPRNPSAQLEGEDWQIENDSRNEANELVSGMVNGVISPAELQHVMHALLSSHKRQLLAAEQLATQEGVARQIANLQARLAEMKTHEVSQIAFTDPLTGLSNRRLFADHLETELASNAPVSLIALDGDDMKKINDTYSHYAGDKYLQGIADTLRDVTRATDTAYRFGGDEFMVLLRGANSEIAQEIASRIQEDIKANLLERIKARIEQDKQAYEARKAAAEASGQTIEAEEFDTRILEAKSLTTSLGIASRESGQTISPLELAKQADKALYNAKYDKHQGRLHGQKAIFVPGMSMPSR